MPAASWPNTLRCSLPTSFHAALHRSCFNARSFCTLSNAATTVELVSCRAEGYCIYVSWVTGYWQGRLVVKPHGLTQILLATSKMHCEFAWRPPNRVPFVLCFHRPARQFFRNDLPRPGHQPARGAGEGIIHFIFFTGSVGSRKGLMNRYGSHCGCRLLCYINLLCGGKVPDSAAQGHEQAAGPDAEDQVEIRFQK